MQSLQKVLARRDNDYAEIAKTFKKRTGLDIVKDVYSKKLSLRKSCSVIVPFYRDYLFLKKNLIAIANQDLPLNYKRDKMEVIIVDGGSSVDLKKLIRSVHLNCPITYLKLNKNYGRATSRNLGLLYSSNEIVIFLDEDAVASKDFISNHLSRHEFSNKLIVAGFRENIDLKDLNLRLDIKQQTILRKPNYRKDFRYKRFVPSEWKETFKNVPNSNFGKTYYILKESDYFKKFGSGKIIGVWNLPFMFVTCNVSAPRRYAFEVGGFDMRFKGWNMEDTHLGAKLIARGLYVIPNLHSTVYHLIKGDPTIDFKRKKIEEYRRNIGMYEELIKESFIVQKEFEWKRKMEKYFKNKFTKVNL